MFCQHLGTDHLLIVNTNVMVVAKT